MLILLELEALDGLEAELLDSLEAELLERELLDWLELDWLLDDVLTLLELLEPELALEAEELLTLELELLEELALDSLDEDDRSSIARMQSLPSPALLPGPGCCRLPVWKFNTSGSLVPPPAALVSVRTACQSTLSGSSTD